MKTFQELGPAKRDMEFFAIYGRYRESGGTFERAVELMRLYESQNAAQLAEEPFQPEPEILPPESPLKTSEAMLVKALAGPETPNPQGRLVLITNPPRKSKLPTAEQKAAVRAAGAKRALRTVGPYHNQGWQSHRTQIASGLMGRARKKFKKAREAQQDAIQNAADGVLSAELHGKRRFERQTVPQIVNTIEYNKMSADSVATAAKAIGGGLYKLADEILGTNQ
jgi:hypothetical protein